MSGHEIRCPNCNTINRVPRYRASRIPWCANCHFKLPEPWTTRVLRLVYWYRREIMLAAAVITVPTIVFGPTLFAEHQLTSVSPPSDLVKAPDTCAGHSQPDTGLYQLYIDGSELVAPLAVHANSDGNYFVLLISLASGMPVESFFIRAGQSIEYRAPLGSFVLKYAKGGRWCGADQLFGPETVTSDFRKQTLVFGETRGHEVWLIPQASGNLRTREIPREQFWHL